MRGHQEDWLRSSSEMNAVQASIVEQCFEAFNRRDLDSLMDGAVECFSDSILLEDTLYWNPISGKGNLRQHYIRVAEQLPSVCKIILDDIAQDPLNGNIAARWHLEVEDNNLLEGGWSRGCSMYTTDLQTGLIQFGLGITESPLKANDAVVNLLLSPLQLLNRSYRTSSSK